MPSGRYFEWFVPPAAREGMPDRPSWALSASSSSSARDRTPPPPPHGTRTTLQADKYNSAMNETCIPAHKKHASLATIVGSPWSADSDPKMLRIAVMNNEVSRTQLLNMLEPIILNQYGDDSAKVWPVTKKLDQKQLIMMTAKGGCYLDCKVTQILYQRGFDEMVKNDREQLALATVKEEDICSCLSLSLSLSLCIYTYKASAPGTLGNYVML